MEALLEVFQQALYLVMIFVAVLVVPGLLVGFAISIFQAATQISESSLSFLPKLFVTLISLAVFSPWLMKMLVDFTTSHLFSLSSYLR